jgi:hypothetical protein
VVAANRTAMTAQPAAVLAREVVCIEAVTAYLEAGS